MDAPKPPPVRRPLQQLVNWKSLRDLGCLKSTRLLILHPGFPRWLVLHILTFTISIDLMFRQSMAFGSGGPLLDDDAPENALIVILLSELSIVGARHFKIIDQIR